MALIGRPLGPKRRPFLITLGKFTQSPRNAFKAPLSCPQARLTAGPTGDSSTVTGMAVALCRQAQLPLPLKLPQQQQQLPAQLHVQTTVDVKGGAGDVLSTIGG